MKNYREIADSVFARREQYMIAQRKKKQVVARATVSVGSVALVSLAGFALWGNDAFHDAPPVTDGGVTTTTAPTGAETTTATAAPSVTTDGDSTAATTVTDAPTQTAATTVATRPSTSHTVKTEPIKTTATTHKTEPSKTTATTAPKKVLITGSTPDDYGADYFGDEAPKFRYGEISPLLKEAMEINKDTNAVFAVMVAVCPRFDQAAVKDEMNKAIEEYKATDEMVQLAEKRQLAYDEWQTANAAEWYKKQEEYRYYANKYDNLLFKFKEEYKRALAKAEVDALAELSETELFDLVADAHSKPSNEVSPIVLVLHNYSFGASYFYSTVLSADAINELAERGSYMFWLDSPDTINEKIPHLFDE